MDTVDDTVNEKFQSVYSNELICFVQQKCSILPFVDLVDICSSFCTSDEIKLALSIIMKLIKQRVPQYKGADKDKKAVTDVVKVCLDPNAKLPQFHALKLHRLPAVDITHADMSAVLQELSLLCNEVRAVAQLRAEMEELRSSLEALRSFNHSVQHNENEFPSLTHAQHSAVSTDGCGSKTFSSLAAGIKQTDFPIATKKTASVRRPVKLVVGKSSNQKLPSVTTKRELDLFISRVPDAEVDSVIDCVAGVVPDVDRSDMECTKLTSKYEELYSSYYVCIRVDSAKMKQFLNLLMAEESWPAGLFVCRYFKKRDG